MKDDSAGRHDGSRSNSTAHIPSSSARRATARAGRKPAQLKVDEEFKRLIPPLTDEERAALEQSLLERGCDDPLWVWRDRGGLVLLDGHNRYEICKAHELPYEQKEVELADRDAAIAWIVDRQLARRNVSDEARSYLRGKRYLLDRRQGARTDRTSGQSGQKSDTAAKLAKGEGVSARTIRRDATYAQQIDRLAEDHGTEIKSAVLSGKIPATRTELGRLLELDRHDREVVLADVRAGASISASLPANPPSKRRAKGSTAEPTPSAADESAERGAKDDNIQPDAMILSPLSGLLRSFRELQPQDQQSFLDEVMIVGMAEREVWMLIKRFVRARILWNGSQYRNSRASLMDPVFERERLIADLTTELKATIDSFRRRAAKLNKSLEQSMRTERKALREACQRLCVDPPAPGRPLTPEQMKNVKKNAKRLFLLYHPDQNPDTAEIYQLVHKDLDVVRRYQEKFSPSADDPEAATR